MLRTAEDDNEAPIGAVLPLSGEIMFRATRGVTQNQRLLTVTKARYAHRDSCGDCWSAI